MGLRVIDGDDLGSASRLDGRRQQQRLRRQQDAILQALDMTACLHFSADPLLTHVFISHLQIL
jgi:hypothetical protein